MAHTERRLKATIASIATTALVVTAVVFGVAPAAVADDPLPSPPPLLQRDDSVVTGDPLPTVQIDNGYVWVQTTIGATVYAAGQFENARAALAAPGTSLTPRSNILAFDINTGGLLPFAPAVNGTIRAVAASPDGSRIYIGGSFNSVNGQPRWNIAALDAQTGQLVPGFSPAIGGSGVYALAVDNQSVYVGGLFTQANGTARKNIAAFSTANGALRMDWDSQSDQQVDTMVMDPGGEKVILGGRFSDVDGDGRWRGMAAINAATGEIDSAWAGTEKIKNGWGTGSNRGKAGIFALSVDESAVYGTGWVFANAATGNIEGVFALDSDSGATRWIADCLGDHYGVYSTGEIVYSTTHTHACSTMGLWPEQSPRTHEYIHAFTADARGTLAHQPHAGATYKDWYGEPAPSAYVWYPGFAVGNTTGMGQAGLSITGAGNVISVAGEFRAVNNLQYEGIVRFSTNPPGGAKDGPRTTTATWGAPMAQTVVPGRIGVSIKGTWDRDDRDLTYSLMREGSNTVVDTVTTSNGWWNVPTVTLTDTQVEPNATYTYTVVVRDGDGNSVTSQPVTATAMAGEPVPYTSAVLDDGANLYYPLGSNTTTDWAGSNHPFYGTGVQAVQPSAVAGSATGYSTFSGNTNGRVSSTNRPSTPSAFSTELWFQTTTNRGGKLVGYGDARTGSSGSYDRHVYMHNDGRLTFGVYPGFVKTVTSADSYNDGQWHHVVATQDTSGMRLYVDGQLVADDPTGSTAQSYLGYWRIGGDNLSGWPNRPTSDWFAGAIDEVAVYSQALTPEQVGIHWAIGAELEAPEAVFSFEVDELEVALDASASTAADGASIVDYAWDFGDESPVVSGADSVATHSFAETGIYPVTLTIRDSNGLVGTVTQNVEVLAPNAAPIASIDTITTGLTVTADGSSSTDSDGSIVAFEWNWGDGESVSTGAVASHAYTAAGTYTIALTVTDDRGGVHTTSRDVTVTHADPVAMFETSATGLTVDVDASGTTASDGATLSFEWDWGDETGPASGETASHTYAAEGDYTITLTVTDSFGSSSSTVRSVTARAAVYAVLDDFDRTVTNGWGAATRGGVWEPMSGSASVASVEAGHGVLEMPPGSTRNMAVRETTLTDSEAVLEYETGFGPSNGAGYVGLVLRQSDTNGYTIHAWHRNNGTIWLVAQNSAGVFATKSISGLSWNTGTAFTLKTEVLGTSPTTLRAKIWAAGSAEPAAWQLEATDSTAALQQAGWTSVRYSLGGSSAATGPVRFDRVAVRDLNEPAENIAPTAEFSSMVSGLTVQVDGSLSSDSDGSVAGYSWNWGDGSAPSSGQTASHAYASAGTYEITLTVTDDMGASTEVTKSVSVTAPVGNVPPVANFTSSVAGVTVSVDGSASADADGSIAAYTWNWGDESPESTGAVASHSYTQPGTYTVTLTVTDDAGATHSVTAAVTIEEAAPTQFVIQDDFERSATSGWGVADVGGAWTISSGSAAAASVSEGAARLNLAPGSTRTALLSATPLSDVDLTVTVGIDVGAETGAAYLGVVARHIGSDYYMLNTWLRPDGTVWLVAQRGSTVITAAPISGLTYVAGDTFNVRVNVEGTGTTNLRGKVWKSAEPEPTDWQLVAADSTAALQGAGSVGFRVNRTSGSSAPAVISIDTLRVSTIN